MKKIIFISALVTILFFYTGINTYSTDDITDEELKELLAWRRQVLEKTLQDDPYNSDALNELMLINFLFHRGENDRTKDHSEEDDNKTDGKGKP